CSLDSRRWDSRYPVNKEVRLGGSRVARRWRRGLDWTLRPPRQSTLGAAASALRSMEDHMAKRKPTGQGATTSPERLRQLLNENLSREYQAIIAYVVYSQVLTGAAYTDIAAQLELHAKQELDHALIISRQIDYLGKMPAVTPKPVRTSTDPQEMLQFDLDNENETVRNYRDRIRQCEALGEYALAEQIRQILVQEQDHQIDLATALGVEVPDVSGGPRSRPLRRRR